ncbi:MAG: Exopolysaccharide synthesis, ExoD [Alphaproteobacteria bacterium ADurb.BinA280]|jgi:hypothetical protein|nr:exopolysaccharide biosynthesis protein [Xanthomonadales bacterium]OPZ12250.1 MAG: Exopolysaccharide synthesis, ExoD [Alphaproteobacteria bacterium ADurb.BinA280]
MTSPQLTSTSQILHRLAQDDTSDRVSFDSLLHAFGRRAFGGLLFIAVLPSFIPAPVGVGAISGPLVSLLGLQMLLLMKEPWLPQTLRKRGMGRDSLGRFEQRFGGGIRRVEKLCQPRLPWLTEAKPALAFSGIQLLLLGILLALPIPFTNYPFGLLLLGYALALIERDGRLLLITWTLGIGVLIASLSFAGEAVQWIGGWF